MFAISNKTPTTRVRWVYDEEYQTEGSYALDTEEETKAAEDEEILNLNNGTWFALGAIFERKCPTCEQWEEKDSVWGIITDGTDKELEQFGKDTFA